VLSHENADLKSRLNEEIRKNHELSTYVKTLEGENAVLKHSYAAPSGGDFGNVLQENRFLKNQLQNEKKWLMELKMPIVATVPPTIAKICLISS
jgi:hypothetical protein